MNNHLDQLNKINVALSDPNCPNREELESVQSDLVELISLLEASGTESNPIDVEHDNEDVIILSDNEWPSTSDDDEDSDVVGTVCKAPLPNGLKYIMKYHYATVIKVSSNKVKVFYNYPLTNRMVPCPNYKRCHFGRKCKFSHGEIFDVGELDEYITSNAETFDVDKLCLVKIVSSQCKLWNLAKITSICQNEQKIAAVLLDTYKVVAVNFNRVVMVDKHDLLPELNPGEFDDNVQSTSGLETSVGFNDNHQRAWVHNSIGTWETHTKGIGSKLMSKMGYIVGTGLGKAGHGMVEPIHTRVLPKKISIDYCTVLPSINQSTSSTVRKRKRKSDKKLKTLTKISRSKEKESNANVFDFLNECVSSRTIKELSVGDRSHKI